jgi:endonuclease/exonuclease/phosphatase family metal-dependent hydrolase
MHERNQYFLRTADRAVYDPAALLDAKAETAVSRVAITENLPVLRIDHISTKSSLLRVRRSQLLKAISVTVMK